MKVTSPDWYRLFVKELCENNSHDILISQKPAPLNWSYYFLDCIKLNEELGWTFSKRWVSENLRILGEQLSLLEELILDGDTDTVLFQIQKEESITADSDDDVPMVPYYENHKTILHYAVLTGNVAMVSLLLSKGCNALLNRNDYITGFTPFHIALFTQNKKMLWHLIRNNADITTLDKFNATTMDYARLLGNIPDKFDRTKHQKYLKLYDKDKNQITNLPVIEFEKIFNVQWTPYLKCDFYYIEELLFSGFSVEEKDMEFRSKYMDIIEQSSGDENLILSKIDDTIGYGVFSNKDYNEGDFIVRYGGFITKESKISNRSYCMTSGIEGVILDATKYRNLGGMINHSIIPNAEAKCIFEKVWNNLLL